MQKLLALFAASILTLSLAACGDPPESDPDDSPTDPMQQVD
jgi:hypothetical protein